jgi:hypothetical protein
MIEKLMLENNFCCVRIADLSNSVFVSMETMDITTGRHENS